MSRIHDALKKAEEERAKRSPNSQDQKAAKFSEDSISAQMDMLEEVVRDVESSLPAPPEILGDQLTVEALQTRVRRLKWNPDPSTMLFFGKDAYALGTEEFRTLRSRLYGLRDMQPLKSILITSASPGEGKSFISANLAQIFVQQEGRRVLLIDADLRWSRVHLSLGASDTPGLTEYLSGQADELSVMQRGPLENLYFIPGGKHASNPAELIANGRLEHLLQTVSPLFDWVIVDSPPAMAVSDPQVISAICDGVILVVAADMGPYEIIQKTRQQFSDRRVLGVVLNRAEARSSYSYKYYGYYQGDGKKARRKGKG